MKLNYDRNSKDPTYFIQMGIRNGKKVTTKNVARIGKHSELLKITDDPLAYAKKQVEEYNKKSKKKKLNITLLSTLTKRLLIKAILPLNLYAGILVTLFSNKSILI